MTTLPTLTILKFIQKYRALEKAPYAEGYALIHRIVDRDGLYDHLCDHWKGKKRDFGAFYLNLSHNYQIRILHQWDIFDQKDQAYLALDNDKRFLAPAPPIAMSLHYLLLYFNNHGIENYAARTNYPAVILPPGFEKLPMKKRFGNSSYWADYILSLPDPEPVLSQIVKYYEHEIARMIEQRSKLKIVDLDENPVAHG